MAAGKFDADVTNIASAVGAAFDPKNIGNILAANPYRKALAPPPTAEDKTRETDEGMDLIGVALRQMAQKRRG